MVLLLLLLSGYSVWLLLLLLLHRELIFFYFLFIGVFSRLLVGLGSSSWIAVTHMHQCNSKNGGNFTSCFPYLYSIDL